MAKLFVILSLVLSAARMSAQSTADSTRLDSLPPVTILATRLPVRADDNPLAVSILDRRYVRTAQPQLTLQESLGAVPGVFVLDDANFAQDLRIAVRGFGARAAFGIRGIKLLIDGIPESAPDGQAQVDNLDLAVIDRLEVLRGASGGLYGNASGGVISLHSETVPASNNIRLCGGAYGLRQLHALAGVQGKNSGFWVALTHQGVDGYREHAAYRSTLANSKWTWAPDSSIRLDVSVNYVNSPRADDPGALTQAQVETNRRAANPNNIRYNAGESLQQGRVGLVFEKRWSKQRRLRLRGYSTWRDFENRLPVQNGGQVAFQRWFTGGGGQYEWGQHRWRFSAGLDLDRQADERQRYDNLDGRRGDQNQDQLETFTGAGGYALAQWKPLARWTFSGGLRLDAVQLRVQDHFLTDGAQSGQSVYRSASPWGGVVTQLNRHMQVYANTTTNFETPTLNELSNNPANSGGFNADLKPQRTVSAETGWRARWPTGLTAEIALYRAVTRRELSPYELPDIPGRTFYRNAGKTLRQGLELALGWNPFANMQVSANYTLARFAYLAYSTPAGDVAGRQLPGLPQHWGLLELRYQPRQGLFAQTQWRYTGRYFADDANARAVGSFLLWNARLGYRRQVAMGELEVFCGSDNLTGAVYFNNIRLNAGGGRYFEPGAGRTVFGGAEWRW